MTPGLDRQEVAAALYAADRCAALSGSHSLKVWWQLNRRLEMYGIARRKFRPATGLR